MKETVKSLRPTKGNFEAFHRIMAMVQNTKIHLSIQRNVLLTARYIMYWQILERIKTSSKNLLEATDGR